MISNVLILTVFQPEHNRWILGITSVVGSIHGVPEQLILFGL